MAEIQGIPPLDTPTSVSSSSPAAVSPPKPALPLPSLPSPPASSSSSPPIRLPRLPSTQTLRAWLPLYLSKTEASLTRLDRLLSSPSGTDALLATVAYSCLTTSSLLSTISARRLHTQVLRLLAVATRLPPNTTILLTPSATASVPRLLALAQSLRALSEAISDFRIFVRLWGLLGLWKWAKGLYREPPEDEVLRGVAWAQVCVNVAFQVLENGAYLASKGVLGWDAAAQSRAWRWSSRFWAAHVGLELGRLGYEWRMKAKETKEKGDGDVEAEGLWRRQMVSNVAYAPLTVHWSREGGLIDDFWVGVLGTIAGGIGLVGAWKRTEC